MSKSSKVIRLDSQASFEKGMTLEQYMHRNTVKTPQKNSDGQQVQEENLYESTINPYPDGTGQVRQKNNLYFINEIDEESAQESNDRSCLEDSVGLLKSQRTKETLFENNQKGEINNRNRNNSISMNATAFFKSSTQEKNTFRIKRLSVSPMKKKIESLNAYASITLYGSKFGQNIDKNAKKASQLVTFYGKLIHDTNQTFQKGTKDTYSSIKRQESKGNFTKKHQIQINQLIQYESNMKNKYIQKGTPIEIKIKGLKDRLVERKNQFC